MHDLKTQLSDYLDHAVVRVAVEDVFEERVGTDPVRPLRPRTPQRSWLRRRGWAVAAVVFVAVVIGGLAVGWLRGDTATPPAVTPATTLAPVTTVPPTTAAPENEAAPVTTPAEVTDADLGTGPELEWELVEGITWLQVADPPLTDVQYVNGEFLVLALDSEGKSILASTSPDGATWTDVSYSLPEGSVSTDWSSGSGDWRDYWVTTELIVTVVETESGIVVAAIERTGGTVTEYPLPADIGAADVGDVHALLAPDGSLLVQIGCCRGWHSPDGQEWTEVLIEDTVGRVGYPVVEVDGVLLLAGQFVEDSPVFGSVNGLEWARVIESEVDYAIEIFAPWDGGVLTQAARDDSSDELALLHLTEEATHTLLLPIGPLTVNSDDDPQFSPLIGAIAGELGILVVNWQGTYLYSSDGSEWSTSTLPNNWGPEEATFISGALGAVGSDSILVTVFVPDEGWRLMRGTVANP